jgi:hypothetical protein
MEAQSFWIRKWEWALTGPNGNLGNIDINEQRGGETPVKRKGEATCVWPAHNLSLFLTLSSLSPSPSFSPLSLSTVSSALSLPRFRPQTRDEFSVSSIGNKNKGRAYQFLTPPQGNPTHRSLSLCYSVHEIRGDTKRFSNGKR